MSDQEQDGQTQRLGANITSDPMDWQIIQQDAQGFGEISLAGVWKSQSAGSVEVRLVKEASGASVSAGLDWQPAETRPDGTWSARLKNIPSGGLYRLETRFHQVNNREGEWSERGDMRHFLGVGDIWVTAGQSNSTGYGRGVLEDPLELGVHLFRNSMVWALAAQPINDSTGTKHLANREYFNPGNSPYLRFARLLKQQLGYPIGLVPTSLGGSSLSQWNPQEQEPCGDLFWNMVDCINAVGGKVKGILWYQGESDCSPEKACDYLDRFVQAVTAWREALHADDLPVITVQLNRFHEAGDENLHRSWSVIREAQRQAAHRIRNVFAVPSFDLPLSDRIHTSSAGNGMLAERLASTVLKVVYGFPINSLAPEIQAAGMDEEKCKITLRFAPVQDRLESIDPLHHPFMVEDEAGVVPIEKVLYPGNSTIELVLSRAAVGKTVAHGGYGADPQGIPFDMERMIPILGFYGVECIE